MLKVAMFRGGKDSAATIALMRDLGMLPDLVVFAEVMFDSKRGISGEIPEHIDWVYGTAKPLIESWGCKFEVVRGKKDYVTIFNERIVRSQYPDRVGKKKGFPLAGRCVIKRDLKVRPVQKYLRSLHEPYIQFLGIAANETDRLNLDKNCRSILNEQGIIEAEAFEIAFRNGLLSPTYDNGKRGGCWFCPSAPVCEFARTKTNHKELWEGLARLDKEEDRVSPYFRYNKTFSEVDKEVDDEISRGIFQQMSILEVLRKNEKGRQS